MTQQRKASDRGDLITSGVATLGRWSLQLVLIAAAAVLIGYVVGELWVVVLPVALALLLTSVLESVSEFLHHKLRFPRALAALLTLLGGIAALGGLLVLVVRSVVSQLQDVASQASSGLSAVRHWVTGPPLNLGDKQIDDALTTVTNELQSKAGAIANGVATGVSTVTSLVVTGVLVLVLSFFFLKDGHRFPPFAEQVFGRRAGTHVRAVLSRSWGVLSGYVKVQVLVALIDALFIGLGLVVLDVPLALTLSVITFLGGFIPIVGAVTAGALAVLVALFTNGFVTAVLVLLVVLAVQQLEGNVLQPVLQSRSLNLHAAVVLLAVTAGGSLFGIVGAFLAVPTTGLVFELARYLGEQMDARTLPTDTGPEEQTTSDGELETDEPSEATSAKQGAAAEPA
ncbi:MAG: AI-2E family transporter [Mycobacteriaceae bacterium]